MLRGPKLRLVASLLVAALGLALTVDKWSETRASRWVIEDLRYEDVAFNRGFRGPPSIHLIGVDGQRFRLVERLWKGVYDGREFAEKLRSDTVATVHLLGGENRFLHGYPVVERFEGAGVVLTLDPRPAALRWLLLAAGPILLVLGVWSTHRNLVPHHRASRAS